MTVFDGPFLGIGVGIDVHGELPDWRALLAESERPYDYLEVYTRGDAGIARQVREAAGPELPLIYHHEGLELVYPDPPAEAALAAAAGNLVELSAPWCIEELAYRRLEGRYLDFFMPALLTEESLRQTVENVQRVQEALPAPVAPENPPYQLPVGGMHILEFMERLGEATGAPLILDLGHLYSFQLCRGAEPLDQLDLLDLSRVIELHVAGAKMSDVGGVTIYEDTHGADDVPEILLEMLREVAPRCSRLKAVTVELEDAEADRVRQDCGRVRSVLESVGIRRGA